MTNGNDPSGRFALYQPNGEILEDAGLSKREYFAAVAMQGILSNFAADERQDLWASIARDAAAAADALIKELNRKK